jgi:hypothetical protein
MAKALEEILGHVPLTEALRANAKDLPNPFPPELFSVSDSNRVLGDRAEYVRITSERRTSRFVKYGAPPRRRSLRDIASQPVRMLHNYEEYLIDPQILFKLRSFERYEQDRGMDWLRYQHEEAARRAQNTRVVATATMLRHGAIYLDSEGNLLPTSSGAAETITANVPAAHQTQVNGVIAASWALANTDLMSHLRNLQQYSLQETGMQIKTALYGINVPSYIQNNDFAVAYLSRNQGMNDKILSTGQIPDGFGGIDRWIPVYTSFFHDDTETVTELWDDDLVVFMPELSQADKMAWWALYEGSYMVPRSMEVQRTPEAALNNLQPEYGMFSYSLMMPPTFGVSVYHGDTFLPAIRNEKAIFQADVAF